MDRPFPAYKGDEPYIFVSYSHKDASAVFPELTKLRNQGFNIWFDEGIEPGAEWREEIGAAILNARVFLYFVSEAAVQSENCRKEVGLADKQKIPTIAIHLEETRLPPGLELTLSDRQAILKHKIPDSEFREKLVSRIAAFLDQPKTNLVPSQPVKKWPKIALLSIIGIVIVGAALMSNDHSRRWITQTAIEFALNTAIMFRTKELEIETGNRMRDADDFMS